MKKILSILAIFAVASTLSMAETVEKEDLFTGFSNIVLHDSFNVTLVEGSDYSTSATIDKRVEECARIYVQGSSLIMEIDQKSMSKELKSSLRKKGTAPLTLNVTVHIPSSASIDEIRTDDNACLSGEGKFLFSRNLIVTAEGSSIVKNLEVKAPKVTLNASKKSSVIATVDASELEVKGSNSSSVSVKSEGISNINVESSSQVDLSGKASNVTVKSTMSAKVNVSAAISKLVVIGKSHSFVDAKAASVEAADIDLSSADCWVVPAKTLKIKLESGSELTYGGNPEIEINMITKSTVKREIDVRSKK